MTPIRILEKESNRRGDLFARLMTDLFFALGYEQPRFSVHKSGREIDLTADHRLEPRRAIAECKATSYPIGGDALNKFVGVLDAEYSQGPPATGYFISLAGFRETAIEQQMQRRTQVVMLGAQEVIQELIGGRMLVPKERAAELAGRLCANLDDLALDTESELLAHERGWIWTIFYTQGKLRTHFVLVHADGTPLARPLADEVIAADQACGGGLRQLACLNSAPRVRPENDPALEDVLAGYARYIAMECGYIQLDGLPTDNEVGSRRLRLESLFVPLHLDIKERDTVKKRQAFGAVLEAHPRLALLSPPGGGKSTLLKRLAVAYVDPARRRQVHDDLPVANWLPLFFRCRELRKLARASFAELLEALSRREGVRQNAAAFLAYVDRELLEGRVLLLVDGLDEISDPGDRAAFVSTLRTALQAYPGVALVVTSREAGFRHVAAHLASICTSATLSSFDQDDIRRLSVAWHCEVVGDSEKVRTDAEQLADVITANDRIRLLAVNPLLLTTLLLVRRWVGTLPTRRAILYGEAVKVLIRTWNLEGHEPLPEEEALPQLCYVASAMMLEGIQKISRPRLAGLLQRARETLPAELGYVKGSVEDFIRRVEDRSSLLMMTGYEVEDGLLVEFFEFRHLTFQEFLTSQAMVQGWHPDRSETDSLTSVLLPHVLKEEWREVIPLSAVLGGKATEALIQALTSVAQERLEFVGARRDLVFIVLGNCLADEAAARPDTVRAAVRVLVRYENKLEVSAMPPIRGRYGPEWRNEARAAFAVAKQDFTSAVGALQQSAWWSAVGAENTRNFVDATRIFVELLASSNALDRCEAAFGCARLCFHVRQNELRPDAALSQALPAMGPALVPLLFSADITQQYAGALALVGLGHCRVWVPCEEPDVLGRLFYLGHHCGHADVRRMAKRAVGSQPLGARDDTSRFRSVPPGEIRRRLETFYELGAEHRLCVLVAAWYRRTVDDAELSGFAERLIAPLGNSFPTLQQLLKSLGASPGQSG